MSLDAVLPGICEFGKPTAADQVVCQGGARLQVGRAWGTVSIVHRQSDGTVTPHLPQDCRVTYRFCVRTMLQSIINHLTFDHRFSMVGEQGFRSGYTE